MLSGLTDSLITRYDAFGDVADLDEAIAAARRSVADTPPGHSVHVAAQMNLGTALRRRGRGTTEDEEIEAYERATSDPTEPGSLMTARARYRLAVSLSSRSKSTGSPADLDAAIDAARAAMEIAPTGLAEPSGWIANLSAWLLERFLNGGSEADLDEAITTARAALAWEPPAEAARTVARTNLANALVTRADRSGDPADLPEAREAAREAAYSRPSDPSLWQNYVFTLHRSYLATGDATLLETADAASVDGLAHVDRTSPAFPSMLANMSVVIRTRDDPERVPAMIALIEDAYPLDEADRVIYTADASAEAERVARLSTQPGEIQLRNELGRLWLTHALKSGKDGLPAYQRSVALFRTCLLVGGFPVPAAATKAAAVAALPVAEALFDRALRSGTAGPIAPLPAMWLRVLDTLPEDNKHRPTVLAFLSGSRVTRFLVCEGEPSLLDEAVSDLRAAADATPVEDRGEILRRIGNLYRMSFEQTGRTGHLTAGIAAVQEAFALAATDLQRSSFQHSLRRLLLARHHATGSDADLDDALRTAREAVQLTPTDDFHYENRLAGVAEALRAQAAHTGDAGPLDEAVQFAVTAANAYADGTFRALQILELTLCLTAHYEAGGPPSLLDAAVGNTRHALGLGTEEIEDGIRLRSALGVALRLRHERGGAVADLDEALDLARAVLAETRPDHHARGPRLSDLAEVLLLRFRREGARA
ncbi:MAG TPA: hypothetical protein VKU35_04355, partial [Candidatus Limnocylindria bacterium]|nr:hypothetical protein [Candidatus Limnocylindria bacterium]